MSSIGRNDPCNCASGKKYKKCCLRYDEDRSHVGRLIWRIRGTLIPHTLDQVLIGMRGFKDRSFKEEPFLHATICEFALRFCRPGNAEETPHISKEALVQISEAVSSYAYDDPIGYDAEEQSKLLESEEAVVPVRVLAKKFEMEFTARQCFGQALHLFSFIPDFIQKNTPEKYPFDIGSAFRKEFGVSPEVYCKTCLVSWDTALNHSALLMKDVIDRVKCVEDISDDACREFLTKHLSADSTKFLQTLEDLTDPNSKAIMARISPLYIYPFVKPWSDGEPEFAERITAPVPNLLAYKASQGTYNQLISRYGTAFTNGFGYLFEEYVGRLLRSSYGPEGIISESEITVESKKPDFIVIEGDKAIIVECKAFRYSKKLVTESTDESLGDALEKVGRALVQIQEFLKSNSYYPILGDRIEEFIPVVVTYGRTYMLTAPALKIPREKMLREKNIDLPEWHLLDIRQLEHLEPHLKAGEVLSELLRTISDSTFPEVLNEVAARTGKDFRDSFLFPSVQELLKSIADVNQPEREEK